jgi:hypothetical protein
MEKVKKYFRRSLWSTRIRVVGPIRRFKMSNFNDQATKIVMGALKEIINDRKYAYVSTTNYKYSNLEDPGKEMVIALVESVLPLLARARAEQIKNEAEELMLKKLS